MAIEEVIHTERWNMPWWYIKAEADESVNCHLKSTVLGLAARESCETNKRTQRRIITFRCDQKEKLKSLVSFKEGWKNRCFTNGRDCLKHKKNGSFSMNRIRIIDYRKKKINWA